MIYIRLANRPTQRLASKYTITACRVRVDPEPYYIRTIGAFAMRSSQITLRTCFSMHCSTKHAALLAWCTSLLIINKKFVNISLHCCYAAGAYMWVPNIGCRPNCSTNEINKMNEWNKKILWIWKKTNEGLIISAKWTEWTARYIVMLFSFCPSVCPSVNTQYLDTNISKTVWDRGLVPITH